MLKVYVCVGSCCYTKGAYCVRKTFKDLIKKYNLENQVEIKSSLCLSYCTEGVSVKVDDTNEYTFIEDLCPENAEERFQEFVLNKLLVSV